MKAGDFDTGFDPGENVMDELDLSTKRHLTARDVQPVVKPWIAERIDR